VGESAEFRKFMYADWERCTVLPEYMWLFMDYFWTEGIWAYVLFRVKELMLFC